nr:vacuolar protein sorting-associated protein 13-like [Leptinotarsa decemlineata]
MLKYTKVELELLTDPDFSIWLNKGFEVDIKRIINIKLLTRWAGRYGAKAYISKPEFKNYMIWKLVAVELRKLRVYLNEPIQGVYSGVTGVFTKPVEGAKEQGVEGFFKGLGKGAVGLVARPVAGVVDFASGSFDVVKRATDFNEDISRLRLPRFLEADGLIRPYDPIEAGGHKLLMELSKGKYAKTDIYEAHYTIIPLKEILLLTNKRISYICHDIFGGWQVEWSYTWSEIPYPPKLVQKGLSITTIPKKKKIFGTHEIGKTIILGDPKLKEDICLKIESLRNYYNSFTL